MPVESIISRMKRNLKGCDNIKPQFQEQYLSKFAIGREIGTQFNEAKKSMQLQALAVVLSLWVITPKVVIWHFNKGYIDFLLQVSLDS